MTAIGPSICRECYEVGEEVAEAFLKEFGSGARDALLEKKTGGKVTSWISGGQPESSDRGRRKAGTDSDALDLYLL